MNKYEIVFESEKIYYVKMTEILVNDYLKMYNDPEIQKFLYGTKKHFNYDQILNWIKKCIDANSITFTMIEKETNEFIGIVEIVNIKDDIGEIVISITKNKQGKHYGIETLNTIIKYGYEKIGLNGFSINVLEINKKAINCYENAGFTIDDRVPTGESIHMSHRKIQNIRE